jgi:hypothetical protein
MMKQKAISAFSSLEEEMSDFGWWFAMMKFFWEVSGLCIYLVKTDLREME